MANTGLSTFMHAKRDEKTGEYAAPGKMAGAIEFKETLETVHRLYLRQLQGLLCLSRILLVWLRLLLWL